MIHDSELRIALVLPDLLGVYGDGGNALVLARRAEWRGIRTQIIRTEQNDPAPAECDIYILGGGEDQAESQAVELLRDSGLTGAADRGAAVLAVCAGLQLLGTSLVDSDGHRYAGLGLLDLATHAEKRRAIGTVVTRAASELGLADPTLIGFENHSGRTVRGAGLAPLGRVRSGTGNGDHTDGAVSGTVIGTYLHGPVLARNPALADHLLTVATGRTMDELALPDIADMRRTAVADGRPHRAWRRSAGATGQA